MTSTFETYLDRLDLADLYRDRTHSRDAVVAAIRSIDSAISDQEGHGFEPTPFSPQPELAKSLGLDTTVELWVKDETNNVSGSHKARHLFGVALRDSLAASAPDAPFAIASCGNAALGASVIAHAVDHGIDVFVPQWANEGVVDQIESLGGRVLRCDRQPGVLGDPAHHAMVEAIENGAVAFSCQGTETPTAIDGGRTLAFEMADTLGAHDGGVGRLDRLFIQVGGGALGSAIVTGLARASDLVTMPVVHAVQPVGNHPLVRAWDCLIADIGGREPAVTNHQRQTAAAELGPLVGDALAKAMRMLTTNPERYMAVWPDEPTSYATGILDDITYDWLALMEAMLTTGGFALVASEDALQRAHQLGHQHTDIAVCPTGSAGLGGLVQAIDELDELVSAGERVAVVFSGHMRPGDPDPLA